MKAIAVETYYPDDQYIKDDSGNFVKDDDGKKQLKDDAKGYRVKALESIQFTEVMLDGFQERGGDRVMTFPGIKLLLKYGLESYQAEMASMPSAHHVEVARYIFTKSSLAEHERKNS